MELLYCIIEKSDPCMQTSWSFVSHDFIQYRQKTRNEFIRESLSRGLHSLIRDFKLSRDDIVYYERPWKKVIGGDSFVGLRDSSTTSTCEIGIVQDKGNSFIAIGPLIMGESTFFSGNGSTVIGRNLHNSGDLSLVLGQNAVNNLELSITHGFGFNRSHTVRVHLGGIGLLKTYNGNWLKLGYNCKSLVQAKLISTEGESAIMNFVIEEGKENRIIRFIGSETQCCDICTKYTPLATSGGFSISVRSSAWFNASLKIVTVN